MSTDKLIIDLNFKNHIIDERLSEGLDSRGMFDLLDETVIDKRTLQLIEIFDFFKAVNYTATRIGAARLFRSLNTPSESLELIRAKQEALREIESNDALATGIEEYLEAYRQKEKYLFRLLNVHYLPISPYKDLRRAMQAVEIMVKAADSLPMPESSYLNSLVTLIKNFAKSPTYKVAKGPSFRTLDGIQARSEKSFFSPSLRFRRGRLSGGSIMPAMPCILFAGAGYANLINPALAKSMALLTGGGILLGFLYGTLLKPMFDNETAILPLRKRLIDSDGFASVVESVAGIDEIMSFKRFRNNTKYPTAIPELSDTKKHFFKARDLRNPVAIKRQENFIANDISLDGCGVTFITGPNSGGKTTYCKTIAQNQILAQIGAPVVASSAQLNIADHIAYQAPSFDSLNDPEGRFGTELASLKKIFFAATPKSLVFLDEIAEGTTSHERQKLSVAILEGFLAISNNTVLVTHSYELAETFRNKEKGQFLQLEFKDDRPTHRLYPGISRDSQAHVVAKKIGFSDQDIQQHLLDKGYV